MDSRSTQTPKADETAMTTHMDAYSEAMDFLYGRLNYERSGLPRGSVGLGLGRMRRLMRRLGDPQLGLNMIHVAGTKGKGSTSTMIAAGLSAAGYRTGLFCSPHLHCLEERYVIDGQMIRRGDLIQLIESIKPIVEGMDFERPEDDRLTFFEVTTAIGLIFFATQNCKAVVLEVGMGGRLDSTNIIRPLVSVITSISLDHTRQLGNTTSAIAIEKAGIIKRGGLTVSGVTDIPARNEIRDIAVLRNSELREFQTDYFYHEMKPAKPILEPSPSSIHVKTWEREWGVHRVPFIGPHQAENAALALAVFDALREKGLEVSDSDVDQGWLGLSMPARVEIIRKNPWLIIDGAHNKASAEALAETMVGHFPEVSGRKVLVFGTTREKDLHGQLQSLLPYFDDIILTRYEHNPRARPIDETEEAVTSLGRCVEYISEKPLMALNKAMETAGPDGLVVITGSLFLAAELRESLLNIPYNQKPEHA